MNNYIYYYYNLFQYTILDFKWNEDCIGFTVCFTLLIFNFCLCVRNFTGMFPVPPYYLQEYFEFSQFASH